MKIGVSTACYYPLETELSLKEVGKAGIDTTEIFFNASIELEQSFIEELKAIKEHYGIYVTSVHPTASLADSFMLFSAYERRLREGLDTFRRYGEIASQFGAKYVILHGGKPNGVLDDDGYCERFLQISDAVAECGAILLQENVVNFRAGNLEFLRKMKKNLGDRAAFCLDVKQSVRNGYSPFDAMEILGNSVKHLHLSDNNKYKDCLLPLDGTFDFKGFLKHAEKCGFSGDGVIEVYRNAYKEYSELGCCLEVLKNSLDI